MVQWSTCIHADLEVVYIFELLKRCMPQSSCMRLCGVYGCSSSRLAFFTKANDIITSAKYFDQVFLFTTLISLLCL